MKPMQDRDKLWRDLGQQINGEIATRCLRNRGVYLMFSRYKNGQTLLKHIKRHIKHNYNTTKLRCFMRLLY
jgi:hypothetical protein